MQHGTRSFWRDNFLGVSLALIGVLCLALTGTLYFGHHGYPQTIAAAGSGGGLAGPDIDSLEHLNKAYEQIARTITPAVVNISTTQVTKVQQGSPFGMDP